MQNDRPVSENNLPGNVTSSQLVSPEKNQKPSFNFKVLLAILGVFTLISTTFIGTYLVQKQQDIRRQAQVTPVCENDQDCQEGYSCINGICEEILQSTPTPTESSSKGKKPPTTNPCTETGCDVGDYYSTEPGSSCSVTHYWCRNVLPESQDCLDGPLYSIVQSSFFEKDCGTEQIIVSCKDVFPQWDGRTVSMRYDNPCAETPSPTPVSLPPGIVCDCVEIRVYDTQWKRIYDFSSLEPGDQVFLSILGITARGSIDKARFTINETEIIETELKKPNTNEYYLEYTIPENIKNFHIKGEIYHTEFGWI